MAQISTVVGVDVSKDRLDIYLHPHGRRFSVANDEAGHRALIDGLAAPVPAMIALEATGGYEQDLYLALLRAGLPCRRLNPLQVRRFGQARGRLAKTDPIDAELIASFAVAVPGTPDRDRPELARLAGLESYRRSMSRAHAALKAARDRVPEELRPLHEDRLRRAAADLRQVERQIALLIDQSPELARRRRVLVSVPGIGDGIATALIALVPEWGELSSRKICALIGVAPYDDKSGRTERGRHIRGGRKHARSALYMAALCALRYNPGWRAVYDRLIHDGKKPKCALTALMRKIAITINAMLATNQPWKHA